MPTLHWACQSHFASSVFDGDLSWSQNHWPRRSAKDELDDMERARRPYSEGKTAANPDPENDDPMFFDYEVCGCMLASNGCAECTVMAEHAGGYPSQGIDR